MNSKIGALLAVGLAALSFVAFGGLGWVLDDGNVARLLTETGPIGPKTK